MNLSWRWVEALQRAGHDTVHWRDIGSCNAPDHEIMAYALQHSFVVLTHDLDFGDILAATSGKGPSVVQVRSSNLSLAAVFRQVAHALDAASDELALGALLSIDLRRARLRLLPLQLAR